MVPVDFTSVTEIPGTKVSAEALEMISTRYKLAADLGHGKDILEVACGAGAGLGLLAREGHRVVAGDVTERMLAMAREHCGADVRLLRFNGEQFPFRAGSFDVVVLYEALYYLENADRFAGECARVLRPGGTVVISSVNRAWPDFNPSPHSTRYFSTTEMGTLLRDAGFQVSLQLGFAAHPSTLRDRVLSLAKRSVVRMGLVPKTMKGKEIMKRLVFGRLLEVPGQITVPPAAATELVPYEESTAESRYKVIYALGHLP